MVTPRCLNLTVHRMCGLLLFCPVTALASSWPLPTPSCSLVLCLCASVVGRKGLPTSYIFLVTAREKDDSVPSQTKQLALGIPSPMRVAEDSPGCPLTRCSPAQSLCPPPRTWI